MAWEIWMYLSESNEGPQRWWEKAETWDGSAWRRLKPGIWSRSTKTWREGSRLCCVMPSHKTRGSGHKLKHRRLCLKNLLDCKEHEALAQFVQRISGVSLGDIQSHHMILGNLLQVALLENVLDQMDPGPFQPQKFCACATHCLSGVASMALKLTVPIHTEETHIGPSSSWWSPAEAEAWRMPTLTFLSVQHSRADFSPAATSSLLAARWHWEPGTHQSLLGRKVSH